MQHLPTNTDNNGAVVVTAKLHAAALAASKMIVRPPRPQDYKDNRYTRQLFISPLPPPLHGKGVSQRGLAIERQPSMASIPAAHVVVRAASCVMERGDTLTILPEKHLRK